VLTLVDIHKSFGDKEVLGGMSFRLKWGLLCTLTGCNGSGKTMLINTIFGFLVPSGGIVEFKRKGMATFAPYHVNRLGIEWIHQDLCLLIQMIPYENILFVLKAKLFVYLLKMQKRCVHAVPETASY